MHETAENNTNVTNAKNLIFGLVLTASMFQVGKGIPLFGFLHDYPFGELRLGIGLTILSLFMLRLSGRNFEKTLLTLGIANFVLHFCINYSGIAAFFVAPVFLFIFSLLLLTKPEQSLRADASVFMSLVFLMAAVHKMNPQYLAGHEFSSEGSFLGYIRPWAPDLRLSPPGSVASPIAYLSVAIEIAIGIGLLARPALFAQITALFLILLSFVHPPVVYVYFFFLPLIILISDETSRIFKKLLSEHAFRVPIIIALVIKACWWEYARRPEAFPYFTFTLSFFILCVHLWILLKSWPIESQSLEVRKFCSRSRSLAMPAILVLMFAGSYFFLPSPLGFNMFSASRFRVPTYLIEIHGVAACEFTRSRWKFSHVTDSSLRYTGNGSCAVRFPTLSGLSTIVPAICETYPQTTFSPPEFRCGSNSK
jgi:hypothetical protein